MSTKWPKGTTNNDVIKYHYLCVAVSGNLVNESTNVSQQKEADKFKIMYEKYCEVVDEVENYSEWTPIPPGLRSELLAVEGPKNTGKLIKTREELIGGSLWRKYSDTKSYVLNYMNPLWRELKPDESIDDLLTEVRFRLWERNEQENLTRRVNEKIKVIKKGTVQLSDEEITDYGKKIAAEESLKIKAFPKKIDEQWFPKEWFVFVSCGLPAGPKALPSFIMATKGFAKGNRSSILSMFQTQDMIGLPHINYDAHIEDGGSSGLFLPAVRAEDRAGGRKRNRDAEVEVTEYSVSDYQRDLELKERAARLNEYNSELVRLQRLQALSQNEEERRHWESLELLHLMTPVSELSNPNHRAKEASLEVLDDSILPPTDTSTTSPSISLTILPEVTDQQEV